MARLSLWIHTHIFSILANLILNAVFDISGSKANLNFAKQYSHVVSLITIFLESNKCDEE